MFYDKPIFFEKNRVFRVYKGGALFGELFNEISIDGNYPEEWVASSVKALNKKNSDTKEGVSRIKGENLYLDDAIKTYPNEILGRQSNMGFLVKILDSAVRLPIQAHPDQSFSRKYFHSNYGKAESWLVLGTRVGAAVYFGFKEGVTKEEFVVAIENSEKDKKAMEHLIHKVEIAVGDVLFIPPKAVHAIGYGCLILEVQEPTDFTIQPEYWCEEYKLSDYEMYLGLDVNTALECFDFIPLGNGKVTPRIIKQMDHIKYEVLIDQAQTDCFCVNRIELKSGKYKFMHEMAVYVVTGGSGTIMGTGYVKNIVRGDYFLVPNNAKDCFELFSDNIQIIECMTGNYIEKS